MDNLVYYDLMLQDTIVLRIKTGKVTLVNEHLVPYGLTLDGTQDDIETRIDNALNFMNWCAKREVVVDRKYVKEILNTLQLRQVNDIAACANIALTHRCLSLQDSYWVRKQNDRVEWKHVNLYNNYLTNTLVPVSLLRKSNTLDNKELVTSDMSLQGTMAKAWIRKDNNLHLLKMNTIKVVGQEVYASKVAQMLTDNYVSYSVTEYDGHHASDSVCFTNEKISYIPMSQFEIACTNAEINLEEWCIEHYPKDYYTMNLVDYLVGNSDRRKDNWGLLIDDKNVIIKFAPLFDFDHCFNTEDLHSLTRIQHTQLEAACEAYKALKLRCISIPNGTVFEETYVKNKVDRLYGYLSVF